MGIHLLKKKQAEENRGKQGKIGKNRGKQGKIGENRGKIDDKN